MGFNKYATICVALMAVDHAMASHTLIQRVARSVHEKAVRHTHSLAQDLRVAFGGVLVPRAAVEQPNHVVYCKSGKQAPFGIPADGGNSSVPTGSVTSTPPANTGSSGTTNHGGSSSSSSVSFTGFSTATSGSTPTGTSSPSSQWKLAESHEGSDFFNGWNFFTGGDPTHGVVTYIDQGTASSSGLLSINSQGHAIMQVETTPVVQNTRNSIRITTQSQYNGGLFIMDSVHMPAGCGIWPAFWTNGPNWPVTGEIDIVEGVNDYTNNQATIHTNVGCTLPTSDSNSLSISGSVIGGTDCAALTTGNQGCGIRASTSNSFGTGFNSNGGGVYAMMWDSTGIAIYFFPANSIPSDITAGAPQPQNWGTPMARWPASSCNPSEFFINHSAIFDTTLCGDWASAVWNTAGIPGQDQSCAQRTGVSTCEAFVLNNGSAMAEAFWQVRSVKIYQSS